MTIQAEIKSLFYSFLRVWFWLINYILCHKSKLNYDSSAAVYKIWFRYKEQSSWEQSSVNDFFGLLEGYFHPSIVLSDSISLYSITENVAVFVDCGDLDVFCSKYGAFVYNTQYLHAKKFIVLSIESLNKIALEIPLPKIPILHVANHGRCGSTILAQIFETIPDTLVISETNPFTDLAEISRQGRVDFQSMKKLCFSTIMCTFKHANFRKSELIFLKCQNVAVYITDLMAVCVPSIKHVYMYRQPLAFVRSYEKIFAVNNLKPVSAFSIKRSSGIGHNPILLDFPVYPNFFVEKLTSFSRLSLIWITGAATFKKLLCKIEIKSITYEDLLTDADNVVSKLLKYAGIPNEVLPDSASVLKQDSQVGTPWTSRHVDKEILEKVYTPITEKLKAEVDTLCKDFDVPCFWNFTALPEKL